MIFVMINLVVGLTTIRVKFGIKLTTIRVKFVCPISDLTFVEYDIRDSCFDLKLIYETIIYKVKI